MTLVGLSEGNVAGEAVSRPDSGKACHAQGLVRGPGQVHGPAGCRHVAHEWRTLAGAVPWDWVLFGNLELPISCITFFF